MIWRIEIKSNRKIKSSEGLAIFDCVEKFRKSENFKLKPNRRNGIGYMSKDFSLYIYLTTKKIIVEVLEG